MYRDIKLETPQDNVQGSHSWECLGSSEKYGSSMACSEVILLLGSITRNRVSWEVRRRKGEEKRKSVYVGVTNTTIFSHKNLKHNLFYTIFQSTYTYVYTETFELHALNLS